MPETIQGGYDDGYSSVPCLWGTEPGSLVKLLLSTLEPNEKLRVLDLGCGEGKNAAALARLKFEVDAVDCSVLAIENGKRAFPSLGIRWCNQDALEYECGEAKYDVVICYGLFHCLRTVGAAEHLLTLVQRATRRGGRNAICAFNDRSQDLSAHPGFDPLLLPHEWYSEKYSKWCIEHVSDADLHETHPHNGIPHHHSMTRILARKP